MDLMLTMGLNEAIDQLAMAISICWYGCVEVIGWLCVEKGIGL